MDGRHGLQFSLRDGGFSRLLTSADQGSAIGDAIAVSASRPTAIASHKAVRLISGAVYPRVDVAGHDRSRTEALGDVSVVSSL